ncbi:MAG: hypothetical protein WDO13_00855 [Verrucomicrobiota bacterium]
MPAPPPTPAPSLWQRGLSLGFLVTGIAALVCDVVLAFRFVPDNPDTIAYRIPRAYFYLSNGSLLHFALNADPRLYFYPFNGALLEAFLIHHRLGFAGFTLISCLSWVVVALGIYRLCRNLGVAELGARGTAWLVAFAPNVLIQATSGNDEIVAAAPMVVGLLFLQRWVQSRQTSHLLLAAIAVGVSCGTKLHFLFLWPLGALIAGLWAVLCFRHPATVGKMTRPLLLPLAAAGAIVALLGMPFMAYNVASSGQVFDKAYGNSVLNRPFRLSVGLQNITLFGAQLLINPIPDLDPDPLAYERREVYDAMNAYGNRYFGWVNQSADSMAPGYHFAGIWPSNAYYHSEDSSLLGFLPALFLAAPFFLFSTPRPARAWLGGLLAAFWVYFFYYSLSVKYTEAVAPYFAYAAMLGGAGLAVLWLPCRRTVFNVLRWALLAAVIMTHLLLGVNTFCYNAMRNIPESFWLQSRVRSIPDPDPRVKREIRSARKICLLFSHEEVMYYWLIRLNPVPIYSTGRTPATDPTALNVSCFQANPAFGRVPLQVFENGKAGLTYLGLFNSSWGREYAFATGTGVERRYPSDTGYIVLHATTTTDAGTLHVSVGPKVSGMPPGAKLQYRYTLVAGNQVLSRRDWSTKVGAELTAPVPTAGDPMLVVEATAGTGKVARADLPLKPGDALLTSRSN